MWLFGPAGNTSVILPTAKEQQCFYYIFEKHILSHVFTKAVGKARAIQSISAPISQLLFSSSGKLTSEVKYWS